jgi:hypothetical protein
MRGRLFEAVHIQSEAMRKAGCEDHCGDFSQDSRF